MTAKKAAAKKAPEKAASEEPKSPQTVKEAAAAAPEPEGEEYQRGYLGVSSDDEDYSMAAEVKRLAED